MKSFSLKTLALGILAISAVFAPITFSARYPAGNSRCPEYKCLSCKIFRGQILDKRYLKHGLYDGYYCPGCKVVHEITCKCPYARRVSFCPIHNKYHKIWATCQR